MCKKIAMVMAVAATLGLAVLTTPATSEAWWSGPYGGYPYYGGYPGGWGGYPGGWGGYPGGWGGYPGWGGWGNRWMPWNWW
ncbi:MAG: hypothetical protein H7836_00165 [Magnetococcus sp. YQC-3]